MDLTKVAQNDTPDLSVVILGYGKEDRLPAFVSALETEVATLGVSYELVLVANYWPGRGDRTPQVATHLAQTNDRLKVIAKPKLGTMGWDMRCGLEAARGNVLAVIDGDGQFRVNDIVRLYRELHRGPFDFYQTYRAERRDRWERRVISKIYNWIFRMAFPGVGLSDINSKPKLMTRAMYDSLHLVSSDWFIDAEIVIKARRLGYRTGQIPSVFEKKEGKSYISVFSLLEFLKNLVIFRIRETLYHSKGLWRRR